MITAIIVSCSGPKSLTKKGVKFQEAGFYDEAIDYYVKALNKNENFIDAKIKLKEASKSVLTSLSSEFFIAYSSRDYKKAVHTFIKMESFVKKVNEHQANLSIASNYYSDFKESKEIYLNSEFKRANNLLAEENFKNAEQIFKEIRTIDSEFKKDEVAQLKNYSILEPKYRVGKSLLLSGSNRAAYYDFDFITNIDEDYRDAKFLKQEALTKAQYNIAVYEFENFTTEKGLHNVIRGQLIDEMLKQNNPFIKLIDRQNTASIIKEQKLTLDGMVQNESAIRVGGIIGAKALLEGKVLNVVKREGNLMSENKRAYSEYRVKLKNEETGKNYYETRYNKVRYVEYTRENVAEITFQFQLVSLETGEILLSRTYTRSEKSFANYATYQGNANTLVPGVWESLSENRASDKVINNRNSVSELRSLFSANKTPVAPHTLINKINQGITSEVIKEVINYNPETIR